MYLAQEATPINETIDDSPNPGTYDAGINIYLLVASLCAVGSIWAGIAIFKERKRLYREQNEEILTDVFPEKKA